MFKKTYWYKKEKHDLDTEELLAIVSGVIHIPFWWSSFRVYNDLQSQNGPNWVITDFKRV